MVCHVARATSSAPAPLPAEVPAGIAEVISGVAEVISGVLTAEVISGVLFAEVVIAEVVAGGIILVRSKECHQWVRRHKVHGGGPLPKF